MNAISLIGLKETARMLRKSPRQIMRYVKAGKLKATGGGHGVAFIFNKAEVEAFRRQHSAIAKTDLLARIAYAFTIKNQPPVQKDLEMVQGIIKPARKENEQVWNDARLRRWSRNWLNTGFPTLWQLRKEGKEGLIEKYIANFLPALADVPEKVKEWAQKIGRNLTPAQMDYLAALFIARQHPVVRYKDGDGNAFDLMFKHLKKTQPLYFTGWQNFKEFTESEMRQAWKMIENHVREDMPCNLTNNQKKIWFDDQRRIFMESGNREDAWWMFFKQHPYNTILDKTLFSAYRRNDVAAIHTYGIPKRKDGKEQDRSVLFPIPPEIAANLIKASSKQLKRGKRQGAAKISAAKVGDVLRIKRFQATRLWVGEKGRKGIRQKIAPDGIAQLAEMLSLRPEELPKSWKTRLSRKKEATTPDLKMTPVQLRCPHCDSPISENDISCPMCNKNVMAISYKDVTRSKKKNTSFRYQDDGGQSPVFIKPKW